VKCLPAKPVFPVFPAMLSLQACNPFPPFSYCFGIFPVALHFFWLRQAVVRAYHNFDLICLLSCVWGDNKNIQKRLSRSL
jgi:hypothetical protein